jgi:hypothetical protein
MAKFKIGDRVVATRSCNYVKKDATGIVQCKSNTFGGWWVLWDTPDLIEPTNDNTWAKHINEIELINEKENMATKQKINELQAQLYALRAELDKPIKPNQPMSVEDVTYEMSVSFDKKYDKAWYALRHLIILRDAWGGGYNRGHSIKNDEGNHSFSYCFAISFPDKPTRDEFETQFADLIETASPLLG